MTTKSIITFSIILAIILFSVPAFAENETDSEELIAFEHKTGAEVRLLQLEKVIERNLVQGEQLLDRLNGTAQEQAEEILLELSALKDEVSSVDLNAEATVLATEYVALKKQAITLSQEFRAVVHAEIEPNRRDEIRNEVRERAKERVERFRERIEEKKQEYNRAHILAVLKRAGINETRVKAAITSGNLTFEELKIKVRAYIANLPDEKKDTIRIHVREKRNETQMKLNQVRDKAEMRKSDLRMKLRERITDGNVSARIGDKRLDNAKMRFKDRAYMNGENMVNGSLQNTPPNPPKIEGNARVRAKTNIGNANIRTNITVGGMN